jgi:vancomycin permeability regulator SanA
MLRDRLDCAIELYNKGVADKIIMSGDHGRTEYDEVNTMKNYAVSKGVPADDVYLDHAGFSTYDTVYRAKEIFCVEKAVIVTQKYHLYRAVYNARSLGIDAYGVNSDPFRYVGQTMRDIREAAARVKDFFYCIFKPEPTYLGEKIDINSVPASATDG